MAKPARTTLRPRRMVMAGAVSFLVSGLLAAAGCSSSDSPAATTVSPPKDEAGTEATVAPDAGEVCLAALPVDTTAYDSNCPIKAPDAPDALDEALALTGLDRCHFGFSKADYAAFSTQMTADPYRMPWFDAVHDTAVRAPSYAKLVVTQLDTGATSKTPVSGALEAAALQYGPSRSALPCVAPAEGDAPLASAIVTLIEDHGGSPDADAVASAVQAIPADLQRALAQVVAGVDKANLAYLSVLEPLSASDRTAIAGLGSLLFYAPAVKGPALGNVQVKDLLANRFDVHAIAEGAVHLAYAIESADLARFAGAKGFSVDVPTPIGRLVFRDAADDTYADDADDPIALLVDTGGADTYRFPAGGIDGRLDPNSARHVGIVIDLAGTDTYAYDEVKGPGDTGHRLPSDAAGRYAGTNWPGQGDSGPISISETPRQGGARMGYGMLFDLGPEGDHYRSLRMSQGFGVAGVGVLYDAGGDDVYEGEAGVQGSAIFGVGLLLDQKGNDTYKTYSYAQGFGFSRGVGVLYDADGTDKYLADVGDPRRGGDPIYVSSQMPCTLPADAPLAQRNNCGSTSFVQGAGFGRRASCGAGDDCVYMSGGFGILRDKAGDDLYTASVYGQATSYWFGVGLLADGAGKDTYDGTYYVLGSGAHFGLSVLLDEAGDDDYTARVGTSIAVGHDYTTSWLVDFGGNDVFHGPNLSFGTGNANGLGALVNIGGNDEYHSGGEPTLGCGNLSTEVDQDKNRQKVPTTGIFVDVGGTDTYDLAVASTIVRGDDQSWLNVREPAAAGITSEHGAGLDKKDGTVSLP
ncbi:hypothetical protein AKJ09_03104 [Labilithrix luteola]|uniref:Uncharacterized protein n=1 Tax=Labilithrix luteola TaxID=1391654 RepID=A0A0K1PSC3_9BACT|nr:hypothetical protein [Labilithrix luteola]AKU96440.1 hypothetical protein AKJ09_03104 [Labilithrix luteola]